MSDVKTDNLYHEPIDGTDGNVYSTLNVSDLLENNAVSNRENTQQKWTFRKYYQIGGIYLTVILITVCVVITIYVTLKAEVDNVKTKFEMFEYNQGNISDKIDDLEARIEQIRNSEIGCEIGWTSFLVNCYYITAESLEWEAAKNKCKTLSGDLVKIESRSMNDFLVDEIIRRDSHTDYWIGLNDIQQEGSFSWVSDKTPIQYQNWTQDEPNDGGENSTQDCVQLWHEKQFYWDDDCCEYKKGFICEKQMNLLII